MEWLIDGSWIATWVALAMVAFPVVVSVYAENRSRKTLLEDMEIYEKWARLDDPALVESCRRHINQELRRLYRPGGNRWRVVKISLFALSGLICIFLLLSGTLLESGYGPVWVLYFVVCVLLVATEAANLWIDRRKQAAKTEYAEMVIRLYDEDFVYESHFGAMADLDVLPEEKRVEYAEMKERVVRERQEIEELAKKHGLCSTDELSRSRAKKRNELRGYKVD